MNGRITKKDLQKIYEEIKEYQNGETFYSTPITKSSYRKINLDFVFDFFNGVSCDNYFLSGKEFHTSKNKQSLYYDKSIDFKLSNAPIIDNGGQVAHIDNSRLEIINKHKRMELNLMKSEGIPIDTIVMTEITPEGLYHFYIRSYEINNQMNYSYCTYFIPVEPGKSEELLQTNLAKQKWVWFVPKDQIRGNIQIEDSDLPKLANKIYKEGLPKIQEALRNGKILEITEEDRKHYQLNEEDKKLINQIQNPQTLEKEALSDLQEKLNSEKFIAFKNGKDNRFKRQQEIRQQIKEENEKIHEWNNSEENPANIRKALREEQLNKLIKQLKAIEEFKQVAPELVTKEQLELLENGYVYLEMLNKANNEVHEIDTGMSEEIRTWYQEHYSNEENKTRK